MASSTDVVSALNRHNREISGLSEVAATTTRVVNANTDSLAELRTKTDAQKGSIYALMEAQRATTHTASGLAADMSAVKTDLAAQKKLAEGFVPLTQLEEIVAALRKDMGAEIKALAERVASLQDQVTKLESEKVIFLATVKNLRLDHDNLEKDHKELHGSVRQLTSAVRQMAENADTVQTAVWQESGNSQKLDSLLAHFQLPVPSSSASSVRILPHPDIRNQITALEEAQQSGVATALADHTALAITTLPSTALSPSLLSASGTSTAVGETVFTTAGV